MKVLLVNTRHYHGGGDSTYAFNLAELLRQNGHSVSFFAMQDTRNLPDANEDLFVSQIDFRAMNEKKNLSNAALVLARSIYSSEARRKFSLILEREKPDVVHLHNIHAHITPSIILEAKKHGLPVVWTLHDYKLVCPNSHFLIDKSGAICEACRGGRFYQAALKRCKKDSLAASLVAALEAYAHRWMGIIDKVDVFLCPSQFLQKKLLESGFPAEKTQHLPLFLPDRMFLNPKDSGSYFLFMGRLEAIKGIQVLVEAARQTPEIEIILAGRAEGDIQTRLDGWLPTNARYVGMKSGEELVSLRQGAIALVMPSVWYENQPLSILEMFACGKAVIASRLGGMKELIGNNERGFLITPSDAAELAGTMRMILKNKKEIFEKGKRAYTYAKAFHSQGYHYSAIMKLYRDLMAVKP